MEIGLNLDSKASCQKSVYDWDPFSSVCVYSVTSFININTSIVWPKTQAHAHSLGEESQVKSS